MPVIKLDDGSVWPRPALDSDDDYSPAHAALYGTPTRQQLVQLASIASAYGWLVTQPSAAKALPKLRAALRAEATKQQVPGGDRS